MGCGGRVASHGAAVAGLGAVGGTRAALHSARSTACAARARHAQALPPTGETHQPQLMGMPAPMSQGQLRSLISLETLLPCVFSIRELQGGRGAGRERRRVSSGPCEHGSSGGGAGQAAEWAARPSRGTGVAARWPRSRAACKRPWFCRTAQHPQRAQHAQRSAHLSYRKPLSFKICHTSPLISRKGARRPWIALRQRRGGHAHAEGTRRRSSQGGAAEGRRPCLLRFEGLHAGTTEHAVRCRAAAPRHHPNRHAAHGGKQLGKVRRTSLECRSLRSRSGPPLSPTPGRRPTASAGTCGRWCGPRSAKEVGGEGAAGSGCGVRQRRVGRQAGQARGRGRQQQRRLPWAWAPAAAGMHATGSGSCTDDSAGGGGRVGTSGAARPQLKWLASLGRTS